MPPYQYILHGLGSAAGLHRLDTVMRSAAVDLLTFCISHRAHKNIVLSIVLLVYNEKVKELFPCSPAASLMCEWMFFKYFLSIYYPNSRRHFSMLPGTRACHGEKNLAESERKMCNVYVGQGHARIFPWL